MITLLIVIAIAVAVAFTAYIALNNAREQAVIAVRESILNAAKQCCSVEGSYPASLSHLENDYGLTINHEDYVVGYEWLGDNIAPAVVVRPR